MARSRARSGRWWPVTLAIAGVLPVFAAGRAVSAETTPAAVESSPLKADDATHKQVRVIHPVRGKSGWKLNSFCVTTDGRIIAAIEREQSSAKRGVIDVLVNAVSGEKNEGDAAAPAAKKNETPADPTAVGEIRVLDASGSVVKQWSLDFKAQAVNVGPDNSVYVGGDGVVARYDLDGKLLACGDSPQVIATRENPEELKRRARETLEENRKGIEEGLKTLEQQKKDFEGKDDKSLTDEQRELKPNIDQMIAAYKRMAVENSRPITDAQVDELANQLAGQDKKISAIAANGKYVFTTTRASKGYGFGVWRSDLDFQNPKRLVDGLSGCCGQMDVQCCGEELVVAENARHRVVRYDADGKQLAAFGKSQRDGIGEGFGGCCNPMNTRVLGDKLYVAESDGRVKLFTREGKYEGLVGMAKVTAGCKSSIVDVSATGDQVFYFDVQKSAICVLQAQFDPKASAEVTGGRIQAQ